MVASIVILNAQRQRLCLNIVVVVLAGQRLGTVLLEASIAKAQALWVRC
jgi:hypothetical protein